MQLLPNETQELLRRRRAQRRNAKSRLAESTRQQLQVYLQILHLAWLELAACQPPAGAGAI